MTTKVVGFAAALLAATLPLGSAWAQVEHAQRTALDVAIRRAQLREALCQQQPGARMPSSRGAVTTAPRLPSSPPVGTGGPVDVGDCSRPSCPLMRW
jgi:hypothetical protein